MGRTRAAVRAGRGCGTSGVYIDFLKELTDNGVYQGMSCTHTHCSYYILKQLFYYSYCIACLYIIESF